MSHRKTRFVQKFGGVYGVQAAGYRLGHVIGVGAFGEVREAQHLETGRRVAIKIVDVARFQEEVARRIKKEIDLLTRTCHRHIIRLLSVHENVEYTGTWCIDCGCTEYDNGAVEGAPCLNCGYDALQHSIPETRYVTFVVQELAAGGELFSILKACGPLSEQLCRYFFRQLLMAVEYMHRNNIIHRDLKPENLVLSAGFDLRVVDFGLATEASDRSGLLHSGIGSQPYTAPEVFYQSQLYGDRGYRGPPADVWSCAVVLYIMLTGKPPFRRPLDRTRGHLKRCKHFCNILKGYYPPQISPDAKDLLMAVFTVNADNRPTIDDIKQHPWYNGPCPRREEVQQMMVEKSKRAWMEMERTQMVSILESFRQEEGSDRDSQDGSVNYEMEPEREDLTRDAPSDHSQCSDGQQSDGPKTNSCFSIPDSGPVPERGCTAGGPQITPPGQHSTIPPPALPALPVLPTPPEGTPSPSPPPAKDPRTHFAAAKATRSLREQESREAPRPLPERPEEARALAEPSRPASHTSAAGDGGPGPSSSVRSSPIAFPGGALPSKYASPSSPLLVAHSAKDLSNFMPDRGSRNRMLPSSLPEPNYLDNLPKRLRDEKKHQAWNDDEATEMFLLDSFETQGGDLPFAMDMEDVEIDLHRENKPHAKRDLEEWRTTEQESQPVYENFSANGPLELLIQHVQSYTKLSPNSYCKVHSTHDNSKMLELVMRQRNNPPLACTVTFGSESPWSKDAQRWTIHIRKHQGSNSDFQAFVSQVKGRALPGFYKGPL